MNYPDLPIAQKRELIAAAIKNYPVVIIAGETGSGKTTQLPKICLELGRARHAQIGCTQPRRVAAVSVAARVADELASPLGAIVGYQIRFGEKTTPTTKIKFMTDGILLAETRRDAQLRRYDTLIIDEAHERTLNIDFLLGFLRRLLPHRRDLKIIISSATLEVQKFSEFFGGAPIIEVVGRNYPVTILYAENNADNANETAKNDRDDDREIPVLVGDGVRKLWREFAPADTLVFVSGEQDIRETVAHLTGAKLPHTEILPLYGRLSQEQQQRIFYPQNLHRIIVATNVAETSLTVPRIRYVIDSGQARLKRYNPRTQIEMLHIERISQASAKQRAGRCGRVSAGVCLRLYSAADFATREIFTPPEIQRSSLASVILQMQMLNLGAVENFPFIEPPASALIKSGYDELLELGALDAQKKLTPLGKQLAALPLEPRWGRMLISGKQSGVGEEMLTIVAALAIPDPRWRPLEQKVAADAAHKKYADKTSDFCAYLRLWEDVEKKRAKLSNNRFHEFCRENFLSWRRLKEWRETRNQLAELTPELTPDLSEKITDAAQKNELLHRAILSGLLSKCGHYHDEEKIYRGARESRWIIFPGSGLASTKPAWIMAAEIVETSRVFARTVAAIDVAWLEAAAKHLLKYNYHSPFFDEEFGCVRAYANATLYGLPIIEKRLVQYGNIDDVAARKIFITEGLVRGKLRCNLDFYVHNQRLLNTLREREDKLRRRDLVISESALFAFYADRLPREINTVNLLERWVKSEKKAGRRAIELCEADVVLENARGLSADLFPPTWQPYNFALTYKFNPGDADDGVTCAIPLGALAGLNPADFAWLVPGLLGEKTALLLRSLPRGIRREIQPFETAVEKIFSELRQITAQNLPHEKPNLLNALVNITGKITGVKITTDDFHPETLPAFLCMNFKILDERGKTIAQGRNLSALQNQCAQSALHNFLSAPKTKFERSRITTWDFSFPPLVKLAGGAVGYPALKDNHDAVTLLLYDTAEQAARVSRQGIARLLWLGLGAQVEKTARSIYLSQTAMLYFATLGDDKKNSPPHALRQEILMTAILGLIDAQKTTPRTAADFAALLAIAQRDFYTAASILGAAVNETLELAQSLHRAIFAPTTPARKISFADMQAQFNALINPYFIREAGAEYLPRLPRYLAALNLRLEKLATNLTRDQKRTQEILPLWEKCVHAFAVARQQKTRPTENLRRARWQLEEYRINLFAQELGAFTAVSAEKIRELLA